jgi:LmbE family N-acetylglucosaminyl deacetylase
MPIMSRPISIAWLLKTGGCIAIVAPHPDDEVLGCGLLIASARRAGVKVIVLVLTDGRASHPRSVRWPPRRLIRLRQAETRRGLARLGGRKLPLHFFGWSDGALAADGQAHRVRGVLTRHGVDTVLVSSPRDFHADHQSAFRLVIRATKNTQMAIGTYEVWSRVGVNSSAVRDTGSAKKRWAVMAHRSQIGGYIKDDQSAFEFDTSALRDLIVTAECYRLYPGNKVGQQYTNTTRC